MPEKKIHIRDYLKIASKRRHLIFTVFTVVFLVAIIGTFSAKPIYLASTKLLIEKNTSANLPTMNYYYIPFDPDFYETQTQLIKSTPVAQKVVNMLSLDKTYESFFKDRQESINFLSGTIKWFKELFSLIVNITGMKMPKQSVEEPAGAIQDKSLSSSNMLAKIISNSITVNQVKNSKIVNVSYMSGNKEIAALVVNSIAKAYIENLLEMKVSSSRSSMQWLTEKAEEERIKLEKSEQALQEYMRNKDIVTLENRLALVPEKLSEVATRIAMAETKRKEMESLYNRVKDIPQNLNSAETIPAIASDQTIQSLRSQIMKAEQNVSDMSRKFGQKHPAMITALDDLKGLKEKKEQEIRRVIETIKNEYEMAKANEENFKRLAYQTKSETLNLNEKFIQYGALKRETETNRQIFDAIVKKIKEQGVTQDVQTVDVWVVEKADIPKYPAKPRKVLNIFLGLFVGLFGGVGLAFFIEYLDNTIKSPEDVEERLGTPVLGIIPLLKSNENSIEEIITKEPQSVFAESYKVVRTAILLSSAVRPPKNILITSISPEDGKTVTSVNLAITISQSENSVLLVDSDLRKPRIHKIFGIDNSTGLSSYLAGVTGTNIILEKVLPNLSVMPSGPIPPNPSELLGSSKMYDLLKVLNGKFDIIIWDSAPLMSVADSLILSKVLDGTIIVAKAGKTTYESVNKGLKSLNDISARFLGIVINALDVKKDDYYYYSYYNYRYSSEKKSRQQTL